jgi:hypothetical protein
LSRDAPDEICDPNRFPSPWDGRRIFAVHSAAIGYGPVRLYLVLTQNDAIKLFQSDPKVHAVLPFPVSLLRRADVKFLDRYVHTSI